MIKVFFSQCENMVVVSSQKHGTTSSFFVPVEVYKKLHEQLQEVLEKKPSRDSDFLFRWSQHQADRLPCPLEADGYLMKQKEGKIIFSGPSHEELVLDSFESPIFYFFFSAKEHFDEVKSPKGEVIVFEFYLVLLVPSVEFRISLADMIQMVESYRTLREIVFPRSLWETVSDSGKVASIKNSRNEVLEIGKMEEKEIEKTLQNFDIREFREEVMMTSRIFRDVKMKEGEF